MTHLRTSPLEEQPDLRGLLALQRVCAKGSVAAAAADIGWSHPTIDHHLVKLERLLKVQLLERTPRGSKPTPAGRFVSDRADEILRLCSQLVTEVRDAQYEAADILRFATLPTLGARIIPALKHLLYECRGNGKVTRGEVPQLEVTIEEISPILTDVEQGRLDLGMIVGDQQALSSEEDRLHFELICTEPVYLCVARDHPLAISQPTKFPPLRLFRNDRWAIGTEKYDPLDEALKRMSAAAGFSPILETRTNDYSVAQHFVQAGIVISLVPQSGLTSDANVHRWRVPQRMLRREILLVTRKTSRSHQPTSGPRGSQSARLQPLRHVEEEIRQATQRLLAEPAE